MGGVDLMDGLMGRYHIRIKTRNIMVRIFYHFLDMAATNAYILYRRATEERWNDPSNDSSETKLLTLPQFREKIAAGLVAYSDKRAVGRPSSRPSTPTTPPPSEACYLQKGNVFFSVSTFLAHF